MVPLANFPLLTAIHIDYPKWERNENPTIKDMDV
jgi:hypothetical protein